MKTKIFALICAASMLSAATPVVIADTGSNAPDITASEHPRPDTQKRPVSNLSFNVKPKDPLSSDRVTDSSAEVQNSAGEQVTMELIEYFRDQTENFAEVIDISDFMIDYVDDANFNELYEMLVYCSPRSYYLLSDNGMYSYFYPEIDNDGFITYIYPIYTKFYKTTADGDVATDDELCIYDPDVYIIPEKLESVKATDKVREKQENFDNTIADIKSHITENSSDFEKLLTFHDYIVMNYKYSWDDFQGKPLSERTHNTVMRLMDTKEGLCESFSVLFNYLAMDAGLDTGFITSYDVGSNTAYHTWNMVKLAMPGSNDENWYNIDVTWDENAVEREIGGEMRKDQGRTVFTHFLMSDDMTFNSHSKTGEYSYVPLGITEDKSLDQAEWKGSDSQIVDVNGTSYFIDYPDGADKPALYKMNGDKVEKVFDDFRVLWDRKDNTAYSGLSYSDGSLFFNDAQNIYEYHLSSGNVTVTDVSEQIEGGVVAAAAESRSRKDQIYSSYKKGNDLYFCTATVDEDGELTLIASAGKTFKTGIEIVDAPVYSDGKITFKLSSDLNKHVIAAVKASNGTVQNVKIKMNRGSMTYEIPNIPEGDVEVILWDLDSMKPMCEKIKLTAK